MTLLHLIPTLNKGGAERLALDICISLSKNPELKIALFTFREGNEYEFLSTEINHQYIPSHFIPSITGKSKQDTKELQSFIDDFQPDIIHSHLFESEMLLSQLNIGKAKRVVHFHDNMVQFIRPAFSSIFSKQKITRHFERKICLNSYKKQDTHFIAISKNTRDFIYENFRNTKTTMLANAIDLKRFTKEDQAKQNYRLVMMGSFVPKKNQKLAILVCHDLIKKGFPVQLDLLGSGEMEIELRNMVERLEMQSQIHFHGGVDHPESYLQAATIYLHTANYEPFGLAILEAMACGLPVVCTDGGGNRDLIQNGENGFMVKDASPEALADKVILLLENEELRKTMGDKAHAFAQQFGMEEYTQKLLEIYRQLL